ncbi:hypothetical protein ACFC1R_25495 [Kitasatospora sp. NPDC056138]|uniref:hypothetical protein n=1 Tax=Kitasatospora sp. NPDC056138 TaxID=3345724 RepID=UPI0035D9260D
MGNSQYTAVLRADGRIFIGRQIINPAPPTGFNPVNWVELTDHPGLTGVPCGIGVANMGNNVFIKTVTTDGNVFETSCATNGPAPTLTCDDNAWVQLTALPMMAAAQPEQALLKPELIRPESKFRRVS